MTRPQRSSSGPSWASSRPRATTPVELRAVARRARLSLATIYGLFPSRDDLIAAAVESWMARNSWSDQSVPAREESPHHALVRMLRQVFEPFERNPWALDAYYRALSSSGGQRLRAQTEALEAVLRAMLGLEHSAYVDDVELVLTSVTFGLIARFVAGDLDVTALLPALERTVSRLTSDNRPDAARVAAAWSRDRRSP